MTSSASTLVSSGKNLDGDTLQLDDQPFQATMIYRIEGM